MIHSVELNLWLSIAAIAFIGARILLWRTRQILARTQPAPVSKARRMPAGVHDTARRTTAP